MAHPGNIGLGVAGTIGGRFSFRPSPSPDTTPGSDPPEIKSDSSGDHRRGTADAKRGPDLHKPGNRHLEAEFRWPTPTRRAHGRCRIRTCDLQAGLCKAVGHGALHHNSTAWWCDWASFRLAERGITLTPPNSGCSACARPCYFHSARILVPLSTRQIPCKPRLAS
jgi:hypothetical protein